MKGPADSEGLRRRATRRCHGPASAPPSVTTAFPIPPTPNPYFRRDPTRDDGHHKPTSRARENLPVRIARCANPLPHTPMTSRVGDPRGPTSASPSKTEPNGHSEPHRTTTRPVHSLLVGTYAVTVPGTSPSTTHATAYPLTVGGGGCASPDQKLGNPGFESGNTVQTASASVIGQNAPGKPARTGTWDAWLNGCDQSQVPHRQPVAAGDHPRRPHQFDPVVLPAHRYVRDNDDDP